MYRSASGSKWKEVLGFDDGYTSSSTSTSPTVPNFPLPATHSPPPQRTTYPRLPRDISLFSTSTLDLLLRPSLPAQRPNSPPQPAPPTLFHLTIQKDPSSTTSTARPDIILHSGPSKASTIISFAKYHTVTQVTDITLCPPTPTPPSLQSTYFPPTNFSFPNPRRRQLLQLQQQQQQWRRGGGGGGGENDFGADPDPETTLFKPRFKTERLCPTGGIFSPLKYSFSHTLPTSAIRERFEWKNSSSIFVRAMEGWRERESGGISPVSSFSSSGINNGGGLKLVRVSTGEVLAVFVGFAGEKRRGGGMGMGEERVVGMFRFLGVAIGGLGGEFEVLALMSVLSVVERLRRVRGEGGYSPP